MTIKRALMGLAPVFLGWIVVMAFVMRASDAAPAALVLFPSDQLMSQLPPETAIMGMSATALIVQNTADMTRDLYVAGAWLVLPAGLAGCLSLTPQKMRSFCKRAARQFPSVPLGIFAIIRIYTPTDNTGDDYA